VSLLSGTKSLEDFVFPRWGKTQLQCVEMAIKQAWKNIKVEHPELLASRSEEDVTNLLCLEMEAIMQSKSVSGFGTSRFETLVRGAKAEDYDGKHIEKAPDLTLRRKGRHPGIVSTHFEALFIECKLIEKGKTPLKYIVAGIRRFVVGEYAWAMPHAMMLGYVRDGKILPDGLMDSYERNKGKQVVLLCIPQGAECTQTSDSTPPQTFTTLHKRPWKHGEYGEPGDIELRHIWLDC